MSGLGEYRPHNEGRIFRLYIMLLLDNINLDTDIGVDVAMITVDSNDWFSFVSSVV